MRVLEAEPVKKFIRMAEDGWRQGWHERNGGNLSCRLRPEEAEAIREELCPGPWRPIGAAVPGLAGEYFLVTGSGKYMQNVARDPEDSLCVLELDEKGENFRVCWGLTGGGRPTSELPAHLLNHQAKVLAGAGDCRVFYHAHPANITALTFVLPPDGRVFTRELWEMMPECPLTFPRGVGVVPWMVPGSRELAEATVRVLAERDAAVWACHGLFVGGTDFDGAFGLMHTVEKAAEILVKVLSMGGKRQTAGPEDLRALSRTYGLGLSEEFLYEK